LGVATLIAAAAACQGTDEGVGGEGDRDGVGIQAYLDALPAARVVDSDGTGTPDYVAGNLGDLAVAEILEDTDFDAALAAIAPVFRASAEDLVLRRATTDVQGDHHFRFAQTKDGRRVIGGEIVLHVRGGMIFAANGSARGDLPAPAAPAIDAADALSAARDGTDAADVAVVEEAPLAYWRTGAELALVYAVDVTGAREDGTPLHDTVLVDAQDGAIRLRMPHIHTAKNRELHNLNHGTSLPGPIARTEGQAPVSDVDVNTNYDLLGYVYDCYSTLFGRDSYNNAGAKLISSVHYSSNYVNAFWNGTQMVYGDGDGVNASSLARSMDVTAHELTHAVTDVESDLIYSGESGGLNEAMSDIFGNVCEWYRDGQVVSANTWIVGDDCWTPGTPGDGLRYMADPELDGSSIDHYADYYSGIDVHYSSGIANLAFHLLSQGGTHPRGQSSVSVTGIGIAKAAQIFYKANVDILTASATFENAKTATEQAAAQLGYSAADIDSVKKAWEAVGVGVPIPPPPTTPLQNDVPVSGLSGSTNAKAYYSLDVPAGATNLVFNITGGSGDADLYVKFGAAPTMSSWDCRPYLGGNNETCTISNIQAGTYYVMLHAYTSYSGATLKGSFTPPGGGGGGGLVINEVDYDNVGTDNKEFVEIYNPTSSAVSLSGHTLVLVNGGNSSTYRTVNLSSGGSLGAGQYLVVAHSSVTVPAGAIKILWSGNDRIQNGAPDGVVLVANGSVVDKLSYEGSITAATVTGVSGTVNLVEGTALASSKADSNATQRSLSRLPNGTDTNNAASDWNTTANVTPGAANAP
jgi:vibriolysin